MTLSVFMLAILVCIVMTRKYTADGVVELQKSASDSLGLESMMGDAAGGASDALSLNVDLETESDLLQSDTLALKVIEDLNLEHTKDFGPHFNPVAWLLDFITPKGQPDPAHASLEDSPKRRRHAIDTFQKNLKVTVTSGSRLIQVSYTDSDPRLAAAVVNDLVQALIDSTFQTKFTATNQVSQWLEGQLGDLRKSSEDLQRKVVALQQGSGIFGAGGTDLQGKPVVYSPVLDRLQESTAQLSQAKMNRILKESVYQVVKTGNPELISQLSGTSMGSASSQGVTNSLTLIQNLRTQESTLQAQIDQDATQFGAMYPKLIEERASMKGLQQELQDEVARVGERAKNDFEIALKSEEGAQEAYEVDRMAAEKLNNQTIEYTILAKEAGDSQELYQDLLKRLKEAGILQGLQSSNLTMVDLARTPAKPTRPNVPLYLAIAIMVGLFLGASMALLVDAIDNKIQGTEEIEALHFPLVGLVPQVTANEKSVSPIMIDSQHPAFGEAIRGLRSTLLMSRNDRPPQVILVVSPSPGEGKSTVSLNLAASFAQFNKKILLIEADLRRPVHLKRFGIKNTGGGLSVFLSDRDAPVTTDSLSGIANLQFVPAGPVPPYPAELLGSDRMKVLMEQWREEFDFIIVDCPPILPVTDSRILQELADTTLLLVRAGSTTRVALRRAYSLMAQHVKDPTNPGIGIILNAISAKSAAYYGYYGYYGGKRYEYGYKAEDTDETS
jgi:capsular exopolysaccharide synthesis family protein